MFGGKIYIKFSVCLALLAGCCILPHSVLATSNACPVTDGGAGDGDGSANGTIQISANATWTMPSGTYGDSWDCTGKSILVTNNSTLTLVGSLSTGAYPYIRTDNLQVNSGSTITGNGKGCARISGVDGSGPDGSGICTAGAAGYGHGGSGGNIATGGASYGGIGGASLYFSLSQAGGIAYGSATLPVQYGSSGGNSASTATSANYGGEGGGIIYIVTTGTMTINGTISANGVDGRIGDGNHSSGGGSGGSIFLSTGTFSGSTCSLTATGGIGATTGSGEPSGGGGGGRIAVKYTTDNSTCLSGLVASTVTAGGSATSPAVAGSAGTLQLNPSEVINITRAYANDTSANNQIDKIIINFNRDITSASVAGSDFSLSGGYTIASASRTDFAQVTLTVNESGSTDITTSLTATIVGSLSDTFGNTITSGSTPVQGASCNVIDGSANDNDRTINGTLTFNSATTWTPTNSYAWNCTGLDLLVTNSATLTFGTNTTSGYYIFLYIKNVTVDAGAKISSDSIGCTYISSINGSGPDGNNICTTATSGYGNGVNNNGGAGGGAYGAGGGNGTQASGGIGYGSSLTPLLFGSMGGSSYTGTTPTALYRGGEGGGVIAIASSGTATINGTLTANGVNGRVGDGNHASGGGSGGSIYLSTGTFAGSTCSLLAKGGNGAAGTSVFGGGGSGGIVTVYYTTDSSSCLSGLAASTVVAGGTAGGGAATAGSTGIFSKNPTQSLSMTRAYAKDSNSNSKIDQIVIAFNTDIASNTVQTNDFTLSNSYTISSASRSGFGEITLNLTESSTTDLNQSLTATVVGSISDSFGNITMTSGSIQANGASCPVIDGSASDLDRVINGTIKINANTTWTPTSAFNWACHATDLWVTNNATLTFGSDLTNGYFGFLYIKNLTIDSGATVTATGQGCTFVTGTGMYGTGPTTANVCATVKAGYGTGMTSGSFSSGGGAGYGGAGGNGAGAPSVGGVTYGSSALPLLFGSMGGSVGSSSPPNSAGYGGTGGGIVAISVSQTATVNGTVSASGNNGNQPAAAQTAGGGSGGSVYLSAATFTGTSCSFFAKGGNGPAGTYYGGGGGGGRVSVYYGTDSSSCLSGLSTATVVGGGTASGSAVAGSVGTFVRTSQSIPRVTQPYFISQATDGTGKVTFSTAIIDSDSASRLKVEYSEDGGATWYDPTISSVTINNGTVDVDNNQTYQIGSVNSIDTDTYPSAQLTIEWYSKDSANNNGAGGPTGYQTDIQVRVTPYDGTNTGTVIASSNFTIDNQNPSGLGSFAVNTSTIGTAAATWIAATDNNFNHYEIWYGTNQSDVQNRTGTATKWDNSNDTTLATATTATTSITGLNSNTSYYFKIWAVDSYGNTSTLSDVNATTVNLGNWASYQIVTITNNTASTLTNFQVMLNVPLADLPGMDANCNDVRVLDSDQKTGIDFFVDTCATNLIVWVELPTLNASATKTIYLYYNNASLNTSASNGDNTFLQFIDENDTWTNGYIGSAFSSVTYTGGLTHFSDTNSTATTIAAGMTLTAVVDAETNVVLEGRIKSGQTLSHTEAPVILLVDHNGSNLSNQYGYLSDPSDASQTAFGYRVSGGATQAFGSGTFTFDTYMRTKIILRRSSSKVDYYMYNDSYSSLGSATNLGYSGGTPTALERLVIATINTANIYSEFDTDFLFFRKYATTEPTVTIGTAPNTPSITSPTTGATQVAVNPTITATPDSGTGTQTKADWQISDDNTFSNSDCSDANIVWCSMTDLTNLTSVTPGASVGTFAHALSGLTALASNTTYYVRTRHTNTGGTSAWSSSVSFTTVNGVRPVASNTSINAAAAAVTLTENTTTTVTATSTVTDNDGCSDLSTVSAKLYRTDIGAGAGDDENNHYTIASCTQDAGSCTGGADTSATYTCSFAVYYYADPTDAGSANASTNWTAQIAPTDATGVGTADTDTIEMGTLAALDVTSSMNFGTLAVNTHTGSTNQTATVTNTGNVNIDINISGANMSCTSGSIPVSNIKYRNHQGFTYGGGFDTALSTTPTKINMNIPQRTSISTTENVYWGLATPTGVGGNCSSSLTFTPIADPNVD